MPRLIAIAGAPGAGKTTVMRLLRRQLSCPYIELGVLREGHLFEPDWSDENEHEMAKAFENLAFARILDACRRESSGPVDLG